MPDFPDFNTLFAISRNEILTRNPRLTVEAVDRPGADANALVAAGAAAGDEVSAQFARGAAGLFLESAEGDALDRYLFDRYGLVRKPASAAVGSVAFSTTVNNASPFTIPAETQLGTSDGRKYMTTAAVLFPAGTTGPVYAPIRSALAGLNQQAAPDTITSILGQISGQAADLAVTNPLATAGADDAETDPSYRARGRAFFTTARRGTLKALEEAALGVPGIRRATALEVIDSMGRPARLVHLIVADAFVDALASLSTSPATFPAQSQVLANGVIDAISDVRAAGVFVEVIVAQVVLVPVSLQLRFFAGSDPDVVSIMARAAIVGYLNSLDPGDSLSVVTMLNELRNIPGLAFFGDEIVSPIGDIVCHPLQVLRSSLALVTTSAIALTSPQVTQNIGTSRTAVPLVGTAIDRNTATIIRGVNAQATQTALNAQSAVPVVASLARPIITQLTLRQLLAASLNQ